MCICLLSNLRGSSPSALTKKQSAQVDLCDTQTVFSPAVTQILLPLFNYHYHQSIQIEFACISAGNKFPADGQIQYRYRSSQSDRPLASLASGTEAAERDGVQRGRDVMSRRGFAPLITQTSPLPSPRILWEKVSRLARVKTGSPCMSRPPVGPASALPTSHLRDMTNASTRLVIAPKMPPTSKERGGRTEEDKSRVGRK